jgi:hypothetical protein
MLYLFPFHLIPLSCVVGSTVTCFLALPCTICIAECVNAMTALRQWNGKEALNKKWAACCGVDVAGQSAVHCPHLGSVTLFLVADVWGRALS